MSFYDVEGRYTTYEGSERNVLKEKNEWEVDFSGSFFSNEKMMGELTVILFVSLLLMYFILCAQFESFLQPLIVLMEIPIDTAFALITLWVFGHTLNLMSAIGIIVTCGIVVNDSILKLDTINELRKAGIPLVEAIHTAGRRTFESDYHDFADNCLCNGAVAVYLGYGVGVAKAVVYCHDWLDGGGNVGQLVYHSFNILVYL